MTPDPRDFDDREQQRLRDLLDEATSDVHPRDGLDAIQSRTKVSPMSARPWFLGTATAVLATAATVTAVAVMGNGTTPTAERGPASSGPTAAADPSDRRSETAADAAEDAANDPPVAVEGAVPVYYVGDTGQGPRLYREFHPGIGTLAVQQAIDDAVGRTPDDPDYRTPWPAGTAVHLSFDGIGDDGHIGFSVTSPSGTSLRDRPASMSPQEAEMAVKQLVYTAQAAMQTSAEVGFYLDGERAGHRLLGVDVSEPLTRGSELETLALVWIIEPGQNATVQDGFKVSGIGAFFEANVAWELHRGGLDGPVVASNADAPVMAEECCTMAPYEFTVDLPADAAPGEYTLRVHDEDMSSGEGPAPFEDTKTITLTD